MPCLLLKQKNKYIQRYILNQSTALIGRKSTCDICVSDPFTSREHAKVSFLDGGQWVIKDLGAKHSLKVNDQTVDEHKLEDGDRIRIGQSVLIFKEETLIPASIVEILSPEKTSFDTKEIETFKPGDINKFLAGEGESFDIHTFKKDRDRLLLLYEFSRTADSNLEYPRVILEEILNSAFKMLPAERGFIAMKDVETGELNCEIMMDKTSGQESEKLEVSRTIIQRVYNEKVSILTENALKDERFNGSKSVRDYNIRSAVCAPLLSQDEGLGVVYLDNRTESGSFSEADLMFLTALCLQAGIALSNAQLHRQIVEENARLMRDMTPRVQIVGESEGMKSVLNIMKKVAPSDITVLIHGETGTGKELIARGIHTLSPRSQEPFVAVNCAAIPNELIESELFGHEKGAFTGASSTQPGKFQLAHGGTIFLDEIGDMSLNTQAKVLRALEEKEFRRVGGTKTIKIDVRVLTATNKDLSEAVSRGEFREDLLYRLNAVTIPLPPLRQRRKDIILLAEYFIMGQGKVLSDEAKAVLKAYDWPGNIRELRNCLDRAVVMGGGKVIQPEDLPAGIRKGKQAVGWPLESLEQMEADHITRVLRSVNWRKTDAAKVLGVTRQTLDNKIAKYKIEKP